MKKLSHAAEIQYTRLMRLVSKLLHLVLVGKAREELLHVLYEKLTVLDLNNEDYRELLDNTRDQIKRVAYLIIGCISIALDFVLFYDGIDILVDQFRLPVLLKLAFPALLVVAEIIISYFLILRQRSREGHSWAYSRLQYFLLIFLLAFSVLPCISAANNFSPEIQKTSFLFYMLSTCLFHIIIFIASCMFHIFLITHSEDLVEAIACTVYMWKRKRLTKEIDRLKACHNYTNMPAFIKSVNEFARDYDNFKQSYPDIDLGLERTMPESLKAAINSVMGRAIIATEPIFDHYSISES